MAETLAKVNQLENLSKAIGTWNSLSQQGIPVAPALRALDLRRVSGGTAPYSSTQLALANLAAARGGTILPHKAPGFFGSISEDIGGMWRSIIHPSAIFHDLSQLPQLPGLISNALGQGGGFRATVHRISQLPVIRMLPEDFLVQSMTDPRGIKAGLHDLAAHPVYTFMDLMPLAEGALGKAGIEGGVRGAAAQAYRHLETQILEKHPEWASRTPEAIMNHLGVGPQQREMMKAVMPEERRLRRATDRLQRRVDKMYETHGVSRARGSELMDMMERGKPKVLAGERKTWENVLEAGRPKHWTEDLAPNERAFVSSVKELSDRFIHMGVNHERGLFWHNGELYGREDSPALWGSVQKYRDAVDKAASGAVAQKRTPTGVKVLTGDEARAEWTKRATYRKGLADQLSAKRPPARFKPLISDDVRGSLRSIMDRAGGTETDWANVVEYLQGGRWHDVPGMDRKVVNTTVREANASWQEMRAAGFDPMFVHHVGGAGSRDLAYPRLVPERRPGFTQLRRRGVLMDSYSKDFTVALSHQGFEWLRQTLTERAVKNLHEVGLFQNAGDVDRAITEQAERELRVGKAQRTFTGEELLDRKRMIRNRDWRRIDFDKALPFRRASVLKTEGETWVPRDVATAFETLRDGPGAIAQKTRVPMQAFRVSVLALSPTYYLHTAIGDAIALAARTSPAAIVRWFGAARKMVEEGKLPPDVALGLRDVPEEVRAWQVEAGGFMGKMMTQLEKVPVFRKGVWRPAEMINDTFRAVAYLEGKSRGGHAAGLELVNKVYQNWDTMSPVERTVVRSVIPFYGWTRYILRYVMSYPFDHPLRASILSNLSRAEMADWKKGGLPDNMRNLIFLGHPDLNGNIKAANLSGLNPFYDVGSYFSLGGFLKRINPLFDPLLVQMGVDPKTHAADLHPQVKYDPETGTLVAVKPSPISTIAGGFTGLFPQVGAIEQLLGLVKDARTLRTSNPDAWRRQVLSGLGLRFIPTQYNVTQTLAKSEINRYQDLMGAISGARKGQLGPLGEYPSFEALVQRLTEANRA